MVQGFLVLFAIVANAELSHKDKMNLVVVDTDGKLVYPAREMVKVSAEIDELEKMSHSLDMKLSQMEDLNLRDPEVWKKYSHTRDAARTATTTLEALRERMQSLDDQYINAEKNFKAKVEPGLLLQMPGDSALLEEAEEPDYQGEGPSKEEMAKEEAKNAQFKMIAENEEDEVEEKKDDEELNEEKTWSADESDVKQPQALVQEDEEALMELGASPEEYEIAAEEKIEKAEGKPVSKWQQAMSLLETGYNESLVATEEEYRMALFLADQGFSMDQIHKEVHLTDDLEKNAADEAELPQERLEEESKAQEEKRREMIQEEKAEKNLKLLNLPKKLKIKSLPSKEGNTTLASKELKLRLKLQDKEETWGAMTEKARRAHLI